MARRAQINFRTRRSLPKFLIELRSKPPNGWPAPLVCAWQILTNEPHLSEQDALSVILESVTASHNCIRAQSQQLKELGEYRVRAEMQKACSRVARCIKRPPAALHRRLDQTIFPVVKDAIIDLEVIELLFETTTKCFERFPTEEASRAALKVLRGQSLDYSAVGRAARRRAEESLAELATTLAAHGQGAAGNVFTALAVALSDNSARKVNDHGRHVMTCFVAELARSWRRARLRPARAFSYLNDAYRGKFHRFAEFIFIAVSPPRDDEVSRSPASIEANPKRAKYQWRVSDDHVRRGLAQKSGLKTP